MANLWDCLYLKGSNAKKQVKGNRPTLPKSEVAPNSSRVATSQDHGHQVSTRGRGFRALNRNPQTNVGAYSN